MHFNAAGDIDNYGNKIFIFLAPCIIILMIFLAEVMKNIDPKKNSYNNFKRQYYMIHFIVSLLMLLIELYTIAVSFDIKIVNISYIMILALGTMFVILGNLMPKFKHNYFVGIRTSWTLADEDVWFKTHRFGGKIWFVGGILMMLTVFLPPDFNFIFFIAIAFIIALIPIIYSYIIYKNNSKKL